MPGQITSTSPVRSSLILSENNTGAHGKRGTIMARHCRTPVSALGAHRTPYKRGELQTKTYPAGDVGALLSSPCEKCHPLALAVCQTEPTL